MEAQLEALAEIQERLCRLENENRPFKQIGAPHWSGSRSATCTPHSRLA